MTIKLGLVEEASADLITVREVAHVYMSHAHTKAFSDALAASLAQFEAMKKHADAEEARTH